jgi:hypothetical protein
MALVICVGCSMWMTCVTSWANNGMAATYMLLPFTGCSWVPNSYLETGVSVDLQRKAHHFKWAAGFGPGCWSYYCCCCVVF